MWDAEGGGGGGDAPRSPGGTVGGAAAIAVEIGQLASMSGQLDSLLERVNSAISAATRVNQAPQLGGLPEARAVAQLDQDVASGGEGSLLGALVAYLETLRSAVEAVRSSATAYQTSDEGNAAALQSTGG